MSWRRTPRQGDEIVSQDPSCDAAFSAARPYTGYTLTGHFGGLVQLNAEELRRYNEDFLKLVATWVYRKFSGRRKGGVPLGELQRFVYPDDKKLELVEAAMYYLLGVFRKKGLIEVDRQTNPQFEQLLRAFDTAAQKGGRR